MLHVTYIKLVANLNNVKTNNMACFWTRYVDLFACISLRNADFLTTFVSIMTNVTTQRPWQPRQEASRHALHKVYWSH